MQAGKCVICRRDTGEKTEVSLEELEAKAGEILNKMQVEMLERARAHREEHTYIAKDMEEFRKLFDETSPELSPCTMMTAPISLVVMPHDVWCTCFNVLSLSVN